MTPLTEEQLQTFAAAADRVLPGQYGPGATAADVGACLESLLRTPSFTRMRERFENGLSLLQSMARAMHHKDFAQCTAVERDELLRRFQQIPHRVTQHAFAALLKVTLIGFLCDPIHGGNRDGIGWKSLGVWFNRRGGAS